ncbi:hypothetical protein PAECIP111893_01808 [Paenibacillus plantiphilus]|uniref:SMI1/KNR4 family protein n=2 Tax=Paenibacillus plantiphilus TaxID=2905650 RepID=A0ABN8GGH2_9BACL|nr:hypothetical protein PAECIP111893_01808 [Paenibacillus plantiphilus]
MAESPKTIKDEARTEHRAGKVNVKFAAYAADFGFHVKPCIAWLPRTKVLIGRIQGPVPLVVIGDLSGRVRLMILDLHSSKLNLPIHMSQDLIKHLALTRKHYFIVGGLDMESKLEFLKEYTLSENQNIKIIPFHEVRGIGSEMIPKSWFNIFEHKDTDRRIELLLEVWKTCSPVTLSNTISYLTENLYEVDLVYFNDRYSILYSVKSQSGEIQYYEGRNPLDPFNNIELQNNWCKIPQLIRNFYENLHNGFYFYASKAMGLVPLENVTFFGDDEWGIIESLNEPIQINLQTTFGFFKNGMSGYVAIDYTNAENDNATLWFSNDQPEYNINFWDTIDEWIVIGFQD